MTTGTILETGRLILRKLRLSDAASVFAYAGDPEMTRFVTWAPHRDERDSEIFIQTSLAAVEERGQPGPYALAPADEPSLVLGTIGGFVNSRLHDCLEIGYAIGRAYWGRGYATEAVVAFVRHLFETREVLRIQALTAEDNIASERVLEKSGFSREGLLRRFMVIHGVAVNMKIWSILRSEAGFLDTQ